MEREISLSSFAVKVNLVIDLVILLQGFLERWTMNTVMGFGILVLIKLFQWLLHGQI